MPHTASQPSWSCRATAATAASRSQSIASRSKSSVNFEPGVAQGTGLCSTPWVGQSTRGTRAWSRVCSWQVSAIRGVRHGHRVCARRHPSGPQAAPFVDGDASTAYAATFPTGAYIPPSGAQGRGADPGDVELPAGHHTLASRGCRGGRQLHRRQALGGHACHRSHAGAPCGLCRTAVHPHRVGRRRRGD